MAGIAGPNTVALGDIAEISIPEGCKFIDARAARTVLGRTGNPIPQNLVGLIIPDSGQWFSLLQLSTDGFVSDKDKSRLDSAAILKSIQRDIRTQNETAAKYGAAPVPEASWLSAPAYDPVAHSLQYALKTSGAESGSINWVGAVLGRRSVLSLTTVLPAQAEPDLASLGKMLKGLAFKPGERYADHQPQDRAAAMTLAGLISNSNGASGPAEVSMPDVGDMVVWSATGLALLICGWFFLSIARRRHKARYYRIRPARVPSEIQPAAAMAMGITGTNGHESAGTLMVRSAPLANGKLRRNGRRHRRKMFSYHAFYSDMVMNLTSSGYAGPTLRFAGVNKDSSAQAQAASGHYAAEPTSGTANLLVEETSKLIESQQRLIEGQRKLIEAQSKLIQEKTNLLNAEAKVLEKQAEFFPEQQLS